MGKIVVVRFYFCRVYIIFYADHSCKEKNNQLSKGIYQFWARFGLILSDPVIRPNRVNTRTCFYSIYFMKM